MPHRHVTLPPSSFCRFSSHKDNPNNNFIHLLRRGAQLQIFCIITNPNPQWTLIQIHSRLAYLHHYILPLYCALHHQDLKYLINSCNKVKIVVDIQRRQSLCQKSLSCLVCSTLFHVLDIVVGLWIVDEWISFHL